MNIFYTASTARHIRDFHLPILERLCQDGHSVTVACRNTNALSGPVSTIEVPYAKSFFSPSNLKAWFRLFSHFRCQPFDLVLTHTALAGFLTRSALALAGKKGACCVHTAHGYLFGKNAPLKGRLTWPFERLCAGVTDAVFTMNAEDYGYAKKLVRKGGQAIAIPGMGVDLSHFAPPAPGEKEKLRKELGLPDGFLLLYAAEFSKRKNHRPLLSAMAQTAPHMRLLLAGDGKLEKTVRRQAARLPSDKVLFLGYIPDTAPLLKACDGAVSCSLSEGLPLGIMEALVCGLPVAASRVKGHTDLFHSDVSCLFNPRNPREIAKCIETLEKTPRGGILEICGQESAASFFIQSLWKLL